MSMPRELWCRARILPAAAVRASAVEVETHAFAKFAHWMARQAGKASTFVAALALLVVWAVTGPLFGWSDTWQLIINTGTTIITFLMVFLIQNTQNRDTEALHLKLDELIRVTKGARHSAMELEDKSEEQLDALKAELLKKPRAPRRPKARGPQAQGPAGEPPAKPNQS
jgi:low affinity Fe/Cu permease